jgi:hypothetical protein
MILPRFASSGLVLIVLLSPTVARADLIPWEFSWSRTPAEIHADAPGTGKVFLTDQTTTIAVNNSTVVATNLFTQSTAPDSTPDRFTNKGYTLILTLTDLASGQSGDLVFTGQINGRLSTASVHLTNTFTGDMDQSLRLGSTLFRVHDFSYTPPSVPSATNRGSISAFVEVLAVPEPTTLSLVGIGSLLLGTFGLGVRRVQQRRGVK